MLWKPYCWSCRRDIADPPTLCPCGRAPGRWYCCTWPPPPAAFNMSASVTYAGETKPRFTSSIKRSITRRDGSIATVITELDQRDPDKSQRRYQKRVISAGGALVKDVDGFLTNQKGLHGNVGTVRDEPSREVPGDPMTVRVGHKWR